jgi:hypothetical protein
MPDPQAQVNVNSASLEIAGFGDGNGTFSYANQEDLAAALTKVIKAHPGNWSFMFGYAAVPKREYFDVIFDGNAKVVAISAIRLGGPN